MKDNKVLKESVKWSYYDKFKDVEDKYLPNKGEGDTYATQIVTAITKLVYKWYNDGDVYDNSNIYLQGWANDLSDYANWLYKYVDGSQDILDRVFNATSNDDYESILKELADSFMTEEYLEQASNSKKQGSIYGCEGPFEFDEHRWDEDEEYWDEEDEFEESKQLCESKEDSNKLIDSILELAPEEYTNLLFKNKWDYILNDLKARRKSINKAFKDKSCKYSDSYLRNQLDITNEAIKEINKKIKEESMKVEKGKLIIEAKEDIVNLATKFKNYNAFKNNFGEIWIVKDPYDNQYKFFRNEQDAIVGNDYIDYGDSEDYVEGWLQGAIKANNKVIQPLKESTRAYNLAKETLDEEKLKTMSYKAIVKEGLSLLNK